MNFPFYAGNGQRGQTDTPAALPVSRRRQLLNPGKYLADPGLVDACNVALLLNQPLLLTGEPGVGKTQLAYSLAWELGFDEPLKFETKSTSTARDLFYTYDALRRFHDAQSSIRQESALPYITYHALGYAILCTRAEAEIAHLLPTDFVHPGKRRSVVLIDEIDKAPRDFPNDILNELENLYFRLPELGNVKVEADPALLPIVIFTSNSEKDLPDAFLRRCIYYNIPFPEDRARLTEIVTNRLGIYTGKQNVLLRDALDLFFLLREPSNNLRKKPSTAELLGWLLTLQEMAGTTAMPLTRAPDIVRRSLSNLVKSAEDQAKAMEIVEQWLTQSTP